MGDAGSVEEKRRWQQRLTRPIALAVLLQLAHKRLKVLLVLPAIGQTALLQLGIVFLAEVSVISFASASRPVWPSSIYQE